ECLVRIDSMLRGEPSPQSWVTGEHLVGTREAMVGEEIAALMCDCVINQANEGARRIRDCGGLMIDVQVEDYTRVRLAGPGKSALGVLFDQADGAVYDVGRMAEKVAPHIVHEGRETIAWHIQLGDHLPAVRIASQPLIESRVVTLEIEIELVRVAPVALAGGSEVEVGELFESARLVAMGEFDQPIPVGLRKTPLARWNRLNIPSREIARQDARAK